ncbi:ABC transporter ATP-binding protein [Chelatococcus asaccharovorans]|uniref:Amino acid/amide ABC transporter ATP-binding protein 2 (HAAT family) n=1 Tax=Chelatococcus asaccharovorans TaxID=28210 RepID=A0A2V3U8N5_9HYPH|nr:ABC transporter ATP-binding protein [Chelatococcus asaccharovorans]MBS7706047.1 ABC transporter ATP-binding protein [Chelatococcus asaccharovorans]PXW59070.1 amino acid/amide ABC transporter ATP-binding protein 2 (HAAT family) [Chelatococcus asaccharovorans]CAH1659714.1 High-affinity branched-chain amino acid transport ATP-binding protein BraG [Chelatococcus asaccharovorans]CAH1684091.1 High-affinity branched-chain amino acid transport ATP-binding protein BraG [Chelatococcus asaccharovorans]
MTACIRFDDVHAYYGGAHILHGVSFAIEPGERVALIGRNGVGKTTVVNSLLGIARIGSGVARIAGRALKNPRTFTAAQLGIAIVPQGRMIVPNLTIEENLILGAAPGRKGYWTLETILALFPILKERARSPGTALSGGQQQMLALGRALMGNPTCLVLDEPSEGLAPVIVDDVADIAAKVAAQGTAILLIEQNLSLVRRAADRFGVMAKGRIVSEGSMAGLDIAALHAHIAI